MLLYPKFSVLTVDRASPLSVKRSGGTGGWEEEAPFQRNEATICHVSQRLRPLLLGNGGKIQIPDGASAAVV
jgi:hypothetical protein